MLRKGGALLLRRSFCSDGFSGPSQSKIKIFDRHLKRKQRDRAAWLMSPKDTLVDTVAENILDRLEDCKKTFPTALCFGGASGAIRRLLHGRGGIEKLIMMDTSYDMLKSCQATEHNQYNDNIETSYIVGDEEFLPIKESSVDLVISCLGLHWTNDLPGAMIQSRLALKPDGLFLAAIMGGETLKELRIACTIAQMEREGGISPRVSPLAQVRDAGNLLTRAGFMLPGVDMDEYTVRYKSALDLIEHLRAMGETNALVQRHKILKRETALATAAVYESMFAAEDGTIPATYQVERERAAACLSCVPKNGACPYLCQCQVSDTHTSGETKNRGDISFVDLILVQALNKFFYLLWSKIIYMTGWREHSSQQQPKRRGSATVSFQDLQKQFGGNTSTS